MSAFTTTSAVGLIGNDIWIESDMKETDLTHVHPGDPVDITIDTYPGCTLERPCRQRQRRPRQFSFSALPAENASGNWVKVVQRIPVRVAVDQKPGDPPLARRHERGDLDRHRQAPLAAAAGRIGAAGMNARAASAARRPCL